MLQPLHILIDSREQAPWAWDANDATTEIAGLSAGDYALASDTEEPKRKGQLRPVRFAIERKSLDDLLSTIAGGWGRFQRELDRMAVFPARVIIVEGDFEDVCFKEVDGVTIPPHHNHPELRPAFVARRIAELSMMGVSVLLCGNAQYAAGMAYRIFRRRAEVGLCEPNAPSQQRDEGAYAEDDCSRLSWCCTEGQAYSFESLGDDAWLTGCPLCGSSDCGRDLTPDQILERDGFYGANNAVRVK